MKVGKVCKGTSIVLFILDFIGSIVLGNEVGKYDFSWTVFLYGIMVGFIFCLLIYALGEIIDQLECSNSNTYELYQLLKEKTPEEPKKSYFSPIPTSTKKEDGDDNWICSKCGTKNQKNAQYCKDCGQYK